MDKETKKKFDFDLAIEEEMPIPQKIKKEVTLEKKSSSVEKLKEHTDKTWICLTRINNENKLTLEIKTIEEATPKEFYEWLENVYPLVKELKKKPEDFKTIKERKLAWTDVVNNLKLFKFSKTSL